MLSASVDIENGYLVSLEYMRGMVQDIEKQCNSYQQEFYREQESDIDKREDFIKNINVLLLEANNLLRKKKVRLDVIDGELTFNSLIQKLATFSLLNEGIDSLNFYWTSNTTCLMKMQKLFQKFRKIVATRLKNNCVSYYDKSSSVRLEISDRYSRETNVYQTEMEKLYADYQILTKSFTSGIHQDLYTESEFSNRLRLSCDLKAFPILRFIPDLFTKLEDLCAISRRWLDRDEKYVRELCLHIKETRNITQRKEKDLMTQKDKHKRVVKSVRAAHILCQSNKEKLHKLERELTTLDDRISNQRLAKECKFAEKQQKESMVDFIEITLTQTKKNFSLQMKRSRLLKQVKDLEKSLKDIETELTSLQLQITEKAQEKIVLKEKVEITQESYVNLQQELDKFTDNLDKIQREITEFTEQLQELEVIQTFKTSPEKLDDLYDRPLSVKLAPSLRNKILRKRKLVTCNRT